MLSISWMFSMQLHIFSTDDVPSISRCPAGVGHRWLVMKGVVGLIFVILAGLTMSGHASPLSIELPPEHCAGESPYKATLRWDLGEDFSGRTEIRVGSPGGNLFTSGRHSGEAETGRWVRPGMRFVLINAADSRILGEVEVSTDDCREEAEESVEDKPDPAVDSPRRDIRSRNADITSPPASSPSVRPPAIVEPLGKVELAEGEYLRLSPPRLRYCGQPVEQAMVRVLWDVTALEVDRARIFLESTNGRLFADGPARGEKITGEWVTNGMRFLLYLPERDEVIAEERFRILPCNVAEYPDEPLED